MSRKNRNNNDFNNELEENINENLESSNNSRAELPNESVELDKEKNEKNQNKFIKNKLSKIMIKVETGKTLKMKIVNNENEFNHYVKQGFKEK